MKGPDHTLATTTLPIMHATAAELRRLLGLRSTRHPQLAGVMLADPAATIAVFRALEQARPGAAEQVGDAAHAVSLIGTAAFTRLLDELPSVQAPSIAGVPGVTLPYSQAAHAARYAAAMGAQRGLDRQSDLATAALLQNPAVLALWVRDPESALRAYNVVGDGVGFDTAYGAELGEPLDDANQRLAQVWGLPRGARQAMGDWDALNPRPEAIRLAEGLARCTAYGWGRDDTHALVAILADFLDLDVDQATAWLHREAAAGARALAHLAYPLPGYRLVQLPGDEPEEADVPLLGRRRKAETEASAAAPDLHTTLTALMRRIRIESGVSQVVFAMLSRDHSRLRTRLALGVDADAALRRLDIDMAHRHLFSALLGKPQSLWLNAATGERYRGHLPAALRGVFVDDGSYLMSLFVGQRPLGVMIGHGGTTDETGYRQFRALCQEAVAVLAAGSGIDAAGPRAAASAPADPTSRAAPG